jgi:hypothetical protein
MVSGTTPLKLAFLVIQFQRRIRMKIPDLVQAFVVILAFNGGSLSPLLLSRAIRRLLQKWPSQYLSANYILNVSLLSVGQLGLLLIVVLLSGGQIGGSAIFFWLILVMVGGVVLVALGLGISGPWVGFWNPKEGDEVSGRTVLVFGCIWYSISVSVAIAVIMVAVIAIGFPG